MRKSCATGRRGAELAARKACTPCARFGTALAKRMAMPKARILVVDDELNARTALRSILSEEGYEIAEASDGEDGLAKISELSPDVVLADVRMPKMDGLALL